MLDDRVRDRLGNWKFCSAQAALKGQVRAGEVGVAPAEALSAVFGDCGCFDGALGSIVNAAVMFLLSETPVSVERSESMSDWRGEFRDWAASMPQLPDM